MNASLTAPSRVRALLARHGLRPDRRRGQHFLVDANVLAKILAAAELREEDRVLEIGPGLGTVTRELAARAERVVAVEVDRRLLPVLEETLSGLDNVTVVAGDALRVDLDALCPGDPGSWKVVANLPYYLTGPLVARLLTLGARGGRPPGRFGRLVVMVQEEVAARLVAAPGSEAYGAFSVLVQYHATAEAVARVSPNCFYPPPEVVSAVVRLEARREPPVAAEPRALFAVVRAAFGQRRKSLRNALSSGLGLAPREVEEALRAAGIAPGRRGETLSLAEFGALAALLGERVSGGPARSADSLDPLDVL